MQDLKTHRSSDQFQLRLPDGMRDRIRAASDRNGRSINAEIVAALEEKFPAPHVDVRAVEGLLHYITSSTGDAQFFDRIREVNEKFAMMGSPLRVEPSKDGTITISAEF